MGKAAHLASIAVDPGPGGTGIGRILIRKVVDCTRQRGATEIRLATYAGMPETFTRYGQID